MAFIFVFLWMIIDVLESVLIAKWSQRYFRSSLPVFLQRFSVKENFQLETFLPTLQQQLTTESWITEAVILLMAGHEVAFKSPMWGKVRNQRWKAKYRTAVFGVITHDTQSRKLILKGAVEWNWFILVGGVVFGLFANELGILLFIVLIWFLVVIGFQIYRYNQIGSLIHQGLRFGGMEDIDHL